MSTIETLAPTALCTGCARMLLVSCFRTDRSKPRGRDTRCKDCTKIRDENKFKRNLSHRDEAIAQGHKKICRQCRSEKTVDRFPSAPGNIGGTSNECQDCFDVRHAKWRSDNAEHVQAKNRAAMRLIRSRQKPETKAAILKKSRLKTQYGMTPQDLEDRKTNQGVKCAICQVPFGASPWGPDAINVDHDHQTGRVRGLLCSKCNRGLGFFCDDPDTLRRAAAYLDDAKVMKCLPL